MGSPPKQRTRPKSENKKPAFTWKSGGEPPKSGQDSKRNRSHFGEVTSKKRGHTQKQAKHKCFREIQKEKHHFGRAASKTRSPKPGKPTQKKRRGKTNKTPLFASDASRRCRSAPRRSKSAWALEVTPRTTLLFVFAAAARCFFWAPGAPKGLVFGGDSPQRASGLRLESLKSQNRGILFGGLTKGFPTVNARNPFRSSLKPWLTP